MCEKIRVLIIDDETSIRQSLKGFFEDYEFKVKTTSSAEEAIKTLKTETFDAAIVDLRLPGMNGDLFILKIGDPELYTIYMSRKKEVTNDWLYSQI